MGGFCDVNFTLTIIIKECRCGGSDVVVIEPLQPRKDDLRGNKNRSRFYDIISVAISDQIRLDSVTWQQVDDFFLLHSHCVHKINSQPLQGVLSVEIWDCLPLILSDEFSSCSFWFLRKYLLVQVSRLFPELLEFLLPILQSENGSDDACINNIHTSAWQPRRNGKNRQKAGSCFHRLLLFPLYTLCRCVINMCVSLSHRLRLRLEANLKTSARDVHAIRRLFLLILFFSILFD